MGSGLQGWGFNLRQFARMYAKKFGVKEEKMMSRLWGANFYDPTTKRWRAAKGENGERGFNKFVVEPLFKVCKLFYHSIESKYEKGYLSAYLILSLRDNHEFWHQRNSIYHLRRCSLIVLRNINVSVLLFNSDATLVPNCG